MFLGQTYTLHVYIEILVLEKSTHTKKSYSTEEKCLNRLCIKIKFFISLPIQYYIPM